jgi:hypothetical protein
MMAEALSRNEDGHQLALDLPERRGGVPRHDGWKSDARRPDSLALCAGCREKEARYGFKDEADDPSAERPRTLCFSCFRMELTRRQIVAARLARGWNAEQAALPLEETLQRLSVRRRRAQIAARHALGL